MGLKNVTLSSLVNHNKFFFGHTSIKSKLIHILSYSIKERTPDLCTCDSRNYDKIVIIS